MGEGSADAVASLKLPKIDDEALKAVRSFLPGKVLGRTAALLALVLPVLFYITPLDQALKNFLGFPLEPQWLWHSVLLGVAVLVVIAQLIAEWHADWARRQALALAVKTEAVQEGYFRIGPYLGTADDRAKFDRADRVHEKVLEWIKRADAVPLYLTGDSGSGKSSVLNAYVLPALRDAGRTVVEARAWQDPEAALGEALARLGGTRKWKLGEFFELRGLLEAASKRTADGFLIVLDQFEEFVILGDPERQKAFAALLADLHAKPIKGLNLLLVLRSDYQTAIDELGLPPLRHGENWVQVGRFTVAAATRFMARSGLALQPNSLDRVVTSASEMDDSPGMIRPVTLNVIGYVLSQGRATAPSLDADRLVRDYIEQSVEQPAIREIAPLVLKELVTEQGTKRPRSERDLVNQSRLRLGEVRAVMNGLWTKALDRPLDPAQGVWELSHDFVARAVTRYLGGQRVDWPAIARAFAAPTLLVLMAAGAAGVIAWNADSFARLSAKLVSIGIGVSDDGQEATTILRFNATKLSEASALLGRMAMLRKLDLPQTKVADVEPLKGLTQLQSLNLSETQVANVEPLKGLTALQMLDISRTPVANVEPLKGLAAPRTLDLSYTRVEDVEPLMGLTTLLTLRLSNTQVANAQPLSGLTALETLDLSYTKVPDIEPLKGLTALHWLDLSGAQIASVEPLKGCTAIEWLGFSRTRVASVEPLKSLTALKWLFLPDAQVASVEPLRSLTALQELSLSGTQVTNVEPLRGLTALQKLDLSNTQVENVDPLRSLTALWWINLSRTQVTNVRA
jgi:Leucine-rich repeat (LRR) protein